MKLTENFTLEEMVASQTATAKKIDNTPSEQVKANLKKLCETVLQPIRDRYGKPIHVSSGYRCPKLNKAVGGVANSKHQTGEAADIQCCNNKELWDVIVQMIKNKEIKVGQLIDEKKLHWIHLSVGTKNQILKL